MTKSFMKNAYKEHIKEVLAVEVERGLGGYQEIAALLNKKEVIQERWNDVDRRLGELDAQMEQVAQQVEVEVVLGERRFQLFVDLSGVEETLRGMFILRHVQRLVSPPPSAEDLEMEENAVRGLEKERLHLRIMHLIATLDMNAFYTDKMLIALAADMRTLPLTREEKESSFALANEAKEKYVALHARKKDLYEECMRGTTLDSFIMLVDECRKVSRNFWKHLFRVKPPTRADFTRLNQDKERYAANLQYYKQRIRQNGLDLASIRGAFNSNTRYYYNLDDKLLYPVPGNGANDAEAEVVLAMEEEKCRVARQKVCGELSDEMSMLIPVYNELQEQLAQVARDIRRKKQKKDGSYITNCPMDECLGKLEEGVCGLCGHVCCKDCLMEKKDDGHVCRKEDLETARELRRNTRPCPKCCCLIYKVEGCDQMWCVKCHTAFSWKTGALVHGVIHNPHFYDYRRQGGRVPRAPGDVPCGGMPNEIEMLNATQRTDNTIMFDMWEHCVWVSETKMPSVHRRFYNTRPVRERRYSIAYLRGKIDRKRLKTLLYTRHMDEIRYSEYYAILEALIDNMAEHMRRYVAGENTEVECRELMRIADQDVRALNKKHGIRLEGVRWVF